MPVAARHITARGLPEVDVRALNRKGLLVPWTRATVTKTSCAGRIVCEAVVTTLAGDRVLIEAGGRSTFADFTHTDRPFGGRRVWFSCPCCLRRVAILYPFACRHCRGVVYASQREVSHHRAIRRAQGLRMRLGGSANLSEPLPPRPWGMWDRTYRRRAEACQRADARSLAGLSAELDRLRGTPSQPAG